MGKHKSIYVPFFDVGDYVIVVNAEKVRVTGKKLDQKLYRRHSGYPGGLKEETLRSLLARRPEEVIRRAVWGMIPHHRLGRRIIRKLKVYRGPSHPHSAQNPIPLPIGSE
jgi:large subunit ribosomal protein L13